LRRLLWAALVNRPAGICSRSDRATARRIALRAIASLAALAALTLPGTSRGAPVRVFAIGHKQRLEDAVSLQAYRDKMRALVDARLRAGAELVQDGVDDVASHVRPLDPNAPPVAVAHFPEDTGLIAGLIGSRGASARSASSSTEAFAVLLTPYGDVIRHYDDAFPELAAQPIRGLVVALTDVLYRAVYETFRDIARDYGLYVSVSLNVATARRLEASDEADLVALLRGPDEPDRSYAYEATSSLPHNVVWLFEPSGEILVPDGNGGLLRSPSETGGELRPSAVKAYLTPIEQTLDKPGGGLSLASGPVRDLEVLDTPVGAIGVVISKDAWMPDVNERFDAKGANLTLQSEAFSSWAYADAPWDPDTFRESGFAHLQSQGGFAFDVAPCLTGNLLDVTFDGQSAILTKRRDKSPPPPVAMDAGFIGQLSDRGFVRVAPWIVTDPTQPGLTLAERRRALAASGVDLLPGSGVPCPTPLAVGACENGYRESVLFADLEMPPGPSAEGGSAAPAALDRASATTSFGANLAVSPGGAGRQRHPRLAARGHDVAVVWDDTRDGPAPQIYFALSNDAGRSFGPAVKVSQAERGARSELLPDVAFSGDDLFVVWQSFAGRNDDAGTIELARLDASGRRLGADVIVAGGATDPPAGRWQPRVAIAADGEPIVVWIDERDPGPDGTALEHVYAARGEDGGDRFAPAVRVDAGAPVPLSQSLDNKWAPAIAVVGDMVHVAWSDFRDYNWDVYTARSSDGARSFASNQRLNGYPDFERLCDSPSLIGDPAGRLVAAWTDLRARQPGTNLFYATSGDGGASFGPDQPLDASRRRVDADAERPSSQTHVALAASGGQLFAAWQDDRSGNDDILFGTLGGPAERSVVGVDRVDDTGDGPSNQYRPSLAVAGVGADARCVVAWEDDREGRLRVYAAARRCATPRPLPPLR
jgi:hypothetical protein